MHHLPILHSEDEDIHIKINVHTFHEVQDLYRKDKL